MKFERAVAKRKHRLKFADVFHFEFDNCPALTIKTMEVSSVTLSNHHGMSPGESAAENVIGFCLRLQLSGTAESNAQMLVFTVTVVHSQLYSSCGFFDLSLFLSFLFSEHLVICN